MATASTSTAVAHVASLIDGDRTVCYCQRATLGIYPTAKAGCHVVGIDPIAVGEIQEIVGRLRTRGIGVLITDHNVRETLRITDRAYIMYEGRILIHGTSEQLANDPRAREIYLGQRFTL